MSEHKEPEFSKIRQILWPIHNYELKKFIPMFFMFFFINFNYSILRIMKDSLVVNAPGSGAEVIPFLKLWGTTPAAIVFVAIYIKLGLMLSRKALFYATLMPFLVFFVVFPYVLYPNLDILHPTVSADWLQSVLPAGLSGFVAIYRNWTFSLFYVLAEIWGSLILSTLYWSFANETTSVKEAKRFYALFLMGANLALLLIAPAARYAKTLGSWSATLTFVLNIAIFSTAAVAGLYWYINRFVLTDPRFAKKDEEVKPKKASKVKLGFFDSIRELGKSRYLAMLALMVLAYGVSINLVEVTWKHNLKQYFNGDPQGFFNFQAMMMSATGVCTLTFLYFGTNNVLRRFGWYGAAIFTPVVLLVTSMLFFANITFSEFLTGVLATMGVVPLFLAAWAGGIQNVLSKSTKYSFFDPTKEMAYIPLDENARRTGKAAIDGVGGRLGKSGGALINIFLIGLFGSIDAITPYVGVITIFIIILWIVCVKKLNKEFLQLTEGKS